MKKKLSYGLVAILIFATLSKLFRTLNVESMISAIKGANKLYLGMGIVCMFIYWGIEAGLIDMLVKKVAPKTHYWTSIKTTIVGQYYSFITPFASGGQPAQLYTLSQDNVPGGKATAVLVGKFLLFQVTVTVYSLALTLMRINSLYSNLKQASVFVFTGLIINTIGLGVIIMTAFKPAALEKFVGSIIRGLSKVKIIRKPDEVINNLNGHIEEYSHSIHYLKNDVKNTAYMFFLSVIQVTAFFSITYFIYRALGLSGASVLDIISLQALLYMAVSFIPIPGTVGASELGFHILLGSIFTSHLITIALLLWRGISYYFGLVLCGILTLMIYLFDNRKQLLHRV